MRANVFFFFIYFDRYALPALMSFDLAGIVFKWRMFDHYVSHVHGANGARRILTADN